MMTDYLVPAAVLVAAGIGGLLFVKFRKPPAREMVTVTEQDFKAGEGPRIEYDSGLGGVPYCGWVTRIKSNKALVEIELVNDSDQKTVLLTGLNPQQNLRLVSDINDSLFMHNKLICNKDQCGQVNILPDGSNWTIAGKNENKVIVDLLAEARAHAKAIDEVDDIIQYKSLRRKQRGYSAPASELAEEEEGPIAINKYG